jgi:hypothetical protein
LFSSRTEDDVVIFLYDDAADLIGQVFFAADDLPLPPAAKTRGCVALYFPRSRFSAVVDMLRNDNESAEARSTAAVDRRTAANPDGQASPFLDC